MTPPSSIPTASPSGSAGCGAIVLTWWVQGRGGNDHRGSLGTRRSFAIPFIGILLCGTGLIALYPYLSNVFLALPLPGRVAASVSRRGE